MDKPDFESENLLPARKIGEQASSIDEEEI